MAKESAVAATANQNAAQNGVSTIVETKINSVVFTTKHSGDEENGFDYLVAVVKTNTAIAAVRVAEKGNELMRNSRSQFEQINYLLKSLP